MITLHQIEQQVLTRLAERKVQQPLAQLLASAKPRSPVALRSVFRPGKVNIIAEIKVASPSEGDIATGTDPVEVARGYVVNGAVGLSILTEETFFKGSIRSLGRVRRVLPSTFILMKDFIVDEYQLVEGLNAGADAVLLIAAMLGADRLPPLVEKAHAYGLHPLVEVHDERDLELAVSHGATFIGVNNRNLKTMQVDVGTSERLASLVPGGATLISESGLTSGDQLIHLRSRGFKGFLIGTHFMKNSDPGDALANLLRSVHAHQS
ncbi:MAG: indole-3-glycerol-phosphate synthase [Acidobacteriales bacterium]|nr:indole-3-glycerol-phosphate synthase [Terriglobales bacterium]